MSYYSGTLLKEAAAYLKAEHAEKFLKLAEALSELADEEFSHDRDNEDVWNRLRRLETSVEKLKGDK